MRAGLSLNRHCIAKLQAQELSRTDAGMIKNQAGLISPDLLEGIVRRWQGDLVGLALFGSAARGDDTEDSDVDLLLVMKPETRIARGFICFGRSFAWDPNAPGIQRGFLRTS